MSVNTGWMNACMYAVHREEGTITRGWMHILATDESDYGREYDTISYSMQIT